MKKLNNLNFIPFAKAHGNGNDAILFIKENCPKIITDSNFIKKICQRRTGIGSDCVIILSKDLRSRKILLKQTPALFSLI